MSFINVDTYWFDKMVDERIEQAFNVASEYSGCGLFDADGKLVDTGSYQLTKGTLLEIIQYQQEQITELIDSYAFTDTIITNSKIDSSMLESLLERVKDIEKYKTLIDVLAIRVSELEKEVEKL